MSNADANDPLREPAEIDISVAHYARVYDYLLGGSDNFAVDREAAERQADAVGGLDAGRLAVRAQRAFLGRAVRYLVTEAGIRQFLDLGTGIPAANNVHQVAQQLAPESRIVYVDNDPIVLAHAHSLLRSSPEGATSYVDGDLRDPSAVLRQAANTLDFSQPIAVVMIAVLHLFHDEDDPHGIVTKLLEAVPSGSYLAVSHLAKDILPDEMAKMARATPRSAQYRLVMRTQDEISRFFDGLELVPPGLVRIDQWRTEPSRPAGRAGRNGCGTPAAIYGAIGHKP
jgi:hypothetical protein